MSSNIGSTSKPPPLEDHNAWVRHWYRIVRVNVIPVVTRYKTAKEGYTWKQWQDSPIPEEVFEQWISKDAFKDGMAVILGKVWRGQYQGKYLNLIDLDNLLAIQEFCTINGGYVPLAKLAEKVIVEQHRDDTNKAHILFYSDIPFVGKPSDANSINDFGRRFRNNEVPAFEIKGLSAHGIVFCTPSFHKNGERYDILGTIMPTEETP
jgi:hypothetical protein